MNIEWGQFESQVFHQSDDAGFCGMVGKDGYRRTDGAHGGEHDDFTVPLFLHMGYGGLAQHEGAF